MEDGRLCFICEPLELGNHGVEEGRGGFGAEQTCVEEILAGGKTRCWVLLLQLLEETMAERKSGMLAGDETEIPAPQMTAIRRAPETAS